MSKRRHYRFGKSTRGSKKRARKEEEKDFFSLLLPELRQLIWKEHLYDFDDRIHLARCSRLFYEEIRPYIAIPERWKACMASMEAATAWNRVFVRHGVYFACYMSINRWPGIERLPVGIQPAHSFKIYAGTNMVLYFDQTYLRIRSWTDEKDIRCGASYEDILLGRLSESETAGFVDIDSMGRFHFVHVYNEGDASRREDFKTTLELLDATRALAMKRHLEDDKEAEAKEFEWLRKDRRSVF